MKGLFTPTNWVYFLVHALVLLGGLGLLGLARIESPPVSSVVIEGVAASLIAAALVGYVVFVYVKLSEVRVQRMEILDRFGFVAAFESRAATIRPEYEKRLARASHSIDVLGFGLRALREDFLKDFPGWAKKAKVRILLLDPRFPNNTTNYARQRDKEERNPDGTIRTDVDAFVEQAKRAFGGSFPPSFQIRLFQALPSVNVFRVDDEIFWGPYLVNEQSRNTPTFVVRKGSVVFERIGEHFDHLWDTYSREVET